MNILRPFGWWCLALLAGFQTVIAADSFSSIYITEVLADNQHGLKDDDGDRPGWVELYNGSGSALSLAGWFLTDTKTNLTKWRLPGITLLPDKYLTVFTSGKARVTNLVHLHTNFRLNPGGGYLALVNRSTNLISGFSAGYPALPPDTSFGRIRGEPALTGPFRKPTPGKPNSIAGPEFVPEVQFSMTSRNFLETVEVALSCTERSAVIHFTLDGSLPTSRSPIWRDALTFTNTTQLRARAYQPGLLPSPPRSEVYLRCHTNALEFTSSLPVMILDTLGSDTPTSSQASLAHLSVYEPVNGRTALTNRPTLISRVSQRVRGSTSSGMPQPGFAMAFIDELNQERSLPLLGLPADSDWILYAPNAYDPVLIHNPFIHQLSRDIGRYSPRTRFVEMFVVRNAGRVREAHYAGLYVLEEKIKIGKHRVNIDRLDASDTKPPQVTGGYVLKVDRLGPGESGLFSSGERGIVYVEPREQTISLPQRAAQRNYLAQFFDDFENALGSEGWKDPTRGYRAYLDVDAAIDFHVLEVLSGNVDALVLSTFFYKPRNGKITFGPHWDFDRALGSTDGRDDDPRNWNTGPFFGGPWWPRLFTDLDFWQQWVDRWQELRRSHFSGTNLNALIDRLATEIKEAQPRQYRRWDFQPRGGSYQSEIALMKDWLANRVDFIDSQLAEPPAWKISSNANRTLTLSAPTNATIYYTLNGTDPRLSQGGASSNAFVYREPIALTNHERIIARTRNPSRRQRGGPPLTTPWSSPVTVELDAAKVEP